MTTKSSTPAPAQQDREDVDLEYQLDLGEASNTEFGRLAIAARREYFARGGRVLNDEEFERELAEWRGGTHLLDDQ